MPINVFGNSSNNSEQKIDTSLNVQKPYLRTNYIESNIEEDLDLENQFRIKNLPDPINIREAASKIYVLTLFNDPSILKNTTHIALNDRNITNARFIQVNQWPQIDSHLTPKLYVDNAIDESTFVRNNKDNDFNHNNLTNINSITLNTQAVNDNQVITKAYVDQFHQENERSRRDLGVNFYDESHVIVKTNQDNDFNDNKLTNLDYITIKRNPTPDNEITNKKYVDDELDKNTIIRFNQTLENSLKISVGNDIYNLQIYNKILLTDITIIKYPNRGVLPSWRIFCNDRNNIGKIQNFIRSTKTNSPTANSGSTVIPPNVYSFMCIESSGNNFGENVFCSWERIDLIQISNITSYYNRFSIQGDLRAMGRFRNQLSTKDNVWLTKFNIPKNEQFSVESTDWIILSLNITEENYGVKFMYDQIDSAHADMCFSNITITHSPY